MKLIKEKYKQLLLPRQFGGITTMLIHNGYNAYSKKTDYEK
jgi:hypothetical protein